MTLLWVASPRVAHVVEYGVEPFRIGGGHDQPRRDGWGALCQYGPFIPAREYDRCRSTSEAMPEVRWCSACVRVVRRRAARWIDTGLIAEVPPGTVVQR